MNPKDLLGTHYILVGNSLAWRHLCDVELESSLLCPVYDKFLTYVWC